MNYAKTLFYAVAMVISTQAAQDTPISVQASRGYIGSRLAGSSFMRQCTKEHGIQDYFSYYQELSQSPLISDDLKIRREMVMIPFFKTLHTKPQEEQEQVFADFTQDKYILNYPLWRLFLAALSYTDVGDKNYILCTALEREDSALIAELLKQGVDVNGTKFGYSSLWYCNRLCDAQILVAHGADIARHHEQNDLISPICHWQDFYDDKNHIAMMDFYLSSGIQFNEKNNFGYRWFKILLNNLSLLGPQRSAVEAKLEVLWNAARSDERAIHALTHFLQKWDFYPIVRNLLRDGAMYRLHQRSLTGQHFAKIKPIAMKHISGKK